MVVNTPLQWYKELVSKPTIDWVLPWVKEVIQWWFDLQIYILRILDLFKDESVVHIW